MPHQRNALLVLCLPYSNRRSWTTSLGTLYTATKSEHVSLIIPVKQKERLGSDCHPPTGGAKRFMVLLEPLASISPHPSTRQHRFLHLYLWPLLSMTI